MALSIEDQAKVDPKHLTKVSSMDTGLCFVRAFLVSLDQFLSQRGIMLEHL